ncbi:hypothetical protein [Sphingomonas sp. VL_57B]|uniref:hypothetical protein n=1 Tax=Sphingomonas sp. VL_57B TaxID=3144220 RepID=UPI0031F5140A
MTLVEDMSNELHFATRVGRTPIEFRMTEEVRDLFRRQVGPLLAGADATSFCGVPIAGGPVPHDGLWSVRLLLGKLEVGTDVVSTHFVVDELDVRESNPPARRAPSQGFTPAQRPMRWAMYLSIVGTSQEHSSRGKLSGVWG